MTRSCTPTIPTWQDPVPLPSLHDRILNPYHFTVTRSFSCHPNDDKILLFTSLHTKSYSFLPYGTRFYSFLPYVTRSYSLHPYVTRSYYFHPYMTTSHSFHPYLTISCSFHPYLTRSYAFHPYVTISYTFHPYVTDPTPAILTLRSYSFHLKVARSYSCYPYVTRSYSCHPYTVGWSDFWEKKLGTRQVMPNCERTPNPKFFFLKCWLRASENFDSYPKMGQNFFYYF